MPDTFDLLITTNAASTTADLRLLDAHGNQLAHHRADFGSLSVSQRQGLFDLRNYLKHYVEPVNHATSMAQIGTCIAEKVLGPDIFSALTKTATQRTLRIQLPATSNTDAPLAAQLARIPWEIARNTPTESTLAESNLLVRVIHSQPSPPAPLALGPQDSLRLLFIFAEWRGSQPLAARQERRALQQLFEQEIYPQYRVEAHFLSHGVTREMLEAQIRDNGGYHVVHWSGHGGQNLLELAKAGGEADHLSGAELLNVFLLAGGFLPQLFFLSACHSGDLLQVQNWNDFEELARPQPLATPVATEALAEPSAVQPGYTSTAHALLDGGVPAVVAMRYAVGDDYTRELAVDFYQALLGYAKPQSADEALATARRLRQRADQRYYTPSDHATPIFYGNEQVHLPRPAGPSPALHARTPRLHEVTELTLALHQHFVGRTWELARLGADFIGGKAAKQPVAVLTGLGGMGKTALTAEALDLWEQRFHWVLLYQAKPELKFEGTLRDIDQRLRIERGRYYQRLQARPADAIYLSPTDDLTGVDRLNRMARNLMQALRDEPILLVLDNFEDNLLPGAEADTPDRAAKDPAWDRCLALLATSLVGSPSRVLITSRWPLAALAGKPCCPVPLGPLPAGEAALYVRGHAGLSQMYFGGDADERRLVQRLLKASRFHPLLMDRLARLATGGTELRPQFVAALTALETSQGYDQLPTLFATARGDAQELAYLEDALKTSIDLLIEAASPDARRLLWMISLANEPVTLGLLASVWQEEAWPLSHPFATCPEVQPLLHYLLVTGLVNQQATSQPENPDLTCHELVRECIRFRMHGHSQDEPNPTENAIRLAYARRLAEVFEIFRHRNLEVALLAGTRAIIYCIEAGDYEALEGFASGVISSVYYPGPLTQLLPYLEKAIMMAPVGGQQWRTRGYLADALCAEGQNSASLPLYEAAVGLATADTAANDPIQKQAWRDISWLTTNWARALHKIGQFDKEQKQRLASQIANEKADDSPVTALNIKVEGLRMDVIKGRAEHVIGAIEPLLAQLQEWLQQHQTNQLAQNTPDAEALVTICVSTLDVARQAARALNDWEAALHYSEAMLALEEAFARPPEDMARARLNRAVELKVLGHFDEAKAELQYCLSVFPDGSLIKAKTYGALGLLYWRLDDLSQAIIQARRALAIIEQYDAPDERAAIHDNLATYLIGSASALPLAVGGAHRVTALIYSHTANLGKNIPGILRNCAKELAAGIILIPRIADLLADPAFHPLAEWLHERQVGLTALQAEVDQFLEQALQAATKQP